jgi:hypothetical protein
MSHTTATAVDPSAVLSSLRAFVCQRPGFDLGNYATMASYRADYRRALQDRDVALDLLRYLERSSNRDCLALALTDTLRRNSGKGLAYDAGPLGWHYTTGQYFPVEFRAAAVRLLASIVAAYWGLLWEPYHKVRATARREFRPQTFRRAFPR